MAQSLPAKLGESDTTGHDLCDNVTGGSTYSVTIPEMSPVGTEFYRIPTIHGNASIQNRFFIDNSTNKNERFDVTDTGIVYLSGYLDYDIDQEFNLSILSLEMTTAGSNVCLKHRVYVMVEDNPAWPLYFNESCCLCRVDRARDRTQDDMHSSYIEFLIGEEAQIAIDVSTPMVWKERLYLDILNPCAADLYIYMDGLDDSLFSNYSHNITTCKCVEQSTTEEFVAGHIQVIETFDKIPIHLQNRSWFIDKRQSRTPKSQLQFVRMNFTDELLQRARDETPLRCEMRSLDSGKTFSSIVTLRVLGCPDGLYGLQCEHICICENGATCHTLDGSCKCAPGWRGPACDIRRSEVRFSAHYRELHFGEYLMLAVTGYNIQLKHDTVTWYLNGSTEFLSSSRDKPITSIDQSPNTANLFIYGVSDNYAGTYTFSVTDAEGNNFSDTTFLSFKGCKNNYFGENCDLVCNCTYGGRCDRYQGCVCPPGRTGAHCENACSPGWFGANCTSRCLCENNSTCSPMDGNCTCMAGTCGQYCDIKCRCENEEVFVCKEDVGQCTCDRSEKSTPTSENIGIITVIVSLLILISLCVGFAVSRQNGHKGFKAIVDTEFDDYIRDLFNKHPDLTELNIERDEVKIIRQIGCGEFGKIELAELRGRKGSVSVAIKSLISARCNPHSYRDFCHEITCLKRLHGHPNIIGFSGIVVIGEPKYIVVEYAARGDLLRYVQNLSKLTITFQEDCRLVQISRDITLAMQYMEEERFIHRDLACRNVFIMEDYVAKIGDFGLSRDIYETGQYCKEAWSQVQGPLPLKWMPLEFLTRGVFDKKSDVWSFGVLLWEIASLGLTPFSTVPTNMMVKFLLEGQRHRKPENCSDKMYAIMLKCWQADPEERPSAKELTDELEAFLKTKKTFFSDIAAGSIEVLGC
ncbi:proto-oncogene tyrosine-protein kinase receptor Ret-like isoform X2 [Ptychodera flava]|uniref:proto-oncogene tyrosine-protein kinase receptor Ret-like isoform X2 n=1 Tax=Ptychodera flava TaxID=63121 RepID=UPI00396A7D91